MISVLLEASGDSNYIADVCNNIADFVKAVGSYAILIIGIALIIVSAVHIVKAFSSRQADWLVIICCLLIGGLLAFGGWKILTDSGYIGGIGKNTVEKMMGDNKPTAIGDVPESDGGSNASEMAKKGVSILASKFIVPFGSALAVCAGVLLVVIAVAMVAKYYFAKGRASISWAKVAVLLVLGSGLFTATPTENSGGWTWVRDVIVGATKDGVGNAVDGNSTTQSDGLTGPDLGSNGSDT